MAKSADPVVISPKCTNVASFFTTTPAFCRPIKAIKSPIPALIAVLTDLGIESTIASRTLKSVSRMNIIPSISTAVNANCHDYPIPSTTEKAKNAFSPIPGASANGSLAHKAIINVPAMAAMAVEVNNALASIPVADNMLGLTARI